MFRSGKSAPVPPVPVNRSTDVTSERQGDSHLRSVALQLENILLPDTSYLINEPELKIGVPTVVIR